MSPSGHWNEILVRLRMNPTSWWNTKWALRGIETASGLLFLACLNLFWWNTKWALRGIETITLKIYPWACWLRWNTKWALRGIETIHNITSRWWLYGWSRWNTKWALRGIETLCHETPIHVPSRYWCIWWNTKWALRGIETVRQSNINMHAPRRWWNTKWALRGIETWLVHLQPV